VIDEPDGVRLGVRVDGEHRSAIHDLHVVLPDPVTPVEDRTRGQHLAVAPHLRSVMILVPRLHELELEETELMMWDVSDRLVLLLEHDLDPVVKSDGKRS
jgi:hypothetical protein